MDVIPGIFGHGVVVESPLMHFSQSKGDDVLEAKEHHRCGMAERFHLINLKREPKSQGSGLNNSADGDQRDSENAHGFV